MFSFICGVILKLQVVDLKIKWSNRTSTSSVFILQYSISAQMEEIRFVNSDISKAAAVCTEMHVSGMQLTALLIHELIHSNMIATEICFCPHTPRGGV